MGQPDNRDGISKAKSNLRGLARSQRRDQATVATNHRDRIRPRNLVNTNGSGRAKIPYLSCPLPGFSIYPPSISIHTHCRPCDSLSVSLTTKALSTLSTPHLVDPFKIRNLFGKLLILRLRQQTLSVCEPVTRDSLFLAASCASRVTLCCHLHPLSQIPIVVYR